MNGRFGKAIVTAAIALGALASPAQAAVTFAPKHDYPASAPWWTAVSDFNGDGTPDVASASFSTRIVSALIGNGDGTFQAPRNTPAAASGLDAIAAGDLNGDGKGDVAVTVNGTPGSVSVHLGNGDGTFAAATSYGVGDFPQEVVIARIDGNASPDIAVANAGNPTGSVTVLLNNGSGSFAPAPGSPVTFPNNNEPQGVAAADFDADGRTDLAVGALNGTNPGVYFLKGIGTGAFDVPAPLGGPGAQYPVAGDLNGDGRPDIVASRPGVGDVVIVKRTATGFDAPATFDPDGPAGTNGRVALTDLDGDGVLDLAVPNTGGPQANKVSIAFGNGNATFTAASHEPAGSFPRQVAVGDFNRDGNPDLVASNSGETFVSVLLAKPPSVTVTGALGFGNQRPGVASGEQTITVRNYGAPRLRTTAVGLAGADAAQFSISTNTCTGSNLAINQTCAVGVKFTPNGLGRRSAAVSIASNGGGSPHSVPLSGIGAYAAGSCANARSGTRGNDMLTGTAFGDRILGLDGNDVLTGLAGNDCLIGGRGRDRLSGGPGKDTLNGGAGDDVETGGSGADRLKGGSGNDRLTGGSGRNSYSGGPGKDTINARNHRGGEKVDCGSGRDRATVDRGDRVKKNCEVVVRR